MREEGRALRSMQEITRGEQSEGKRERKSGERDERSGDIRRIKGVCSSLYTHLSSCLSLHSRALCMCAHVFERADQRFLNPSISTKTCPVIQFMVASTLP